MGTSQNRPCIGRMYYCGVGSSPWPSTAPTIIQGIFTDVFSTPGRAQSLRIPLQSTLMPVFVPDLTSGLLWVTMRACMCLAHFMVLVGIVAVRVVSSNRPDAKHGLPKSEDLSAPSEPQSLMVSSGGWGWVLDHQSFTNTPCKVQRGSEGHIFGIRPHCQCMTCLLHVKHVYYTSSCESLAHLYTVSISRLHHVSE